MYTMWPLLSWSKFQWGHTNHSNCLLIQISSHTRRRQWLHVASFSPNIQIYSA